MSPDEIASMDAITYIAFAMSIIVLGYSTLNLYKIKRELNKTEDLLCSIVVTSKEMMNEHVKIHAYNNLKCCGMNLDERTVTIVFDDSEQVIEFIETHESSTGLRMVRDGQVVKTGFCDGCE